MKVVAFYSFKGGVGRTMSLLSVAYTLAQRGRKVVVADWDLQAPGLSLMECMWPQDGGMPRLGILEYLLALRPEHQTRGDVSIESMLTAPRLIDDARHREEPDEKYRMKGDVAFIPAGDLGEGVEKFIESVKQVDLLNLKTFLADLDGDPRMVFKVFRHQVEQAKIPWRGEDQQGSPDYLLVDCRTGITEVGDLLLGDATDFNVIVYGQDAQNLEGLQIVLNASAREPGDLVANTMLIWSGGVQGQELLKREQRRRKQQLKDSVCLVDSLGLAEPFPREFEVPFNPELVMSNVPLVHRVPDSDFAAQFAEITDYVEERCLWDDSVVESLIAPFDPRSPESPQQRQMRIASATPAQKERHLQMARVDLERSRGLTSLLFKPPTWNLASVPTTDLVNEWPEGFSEHDRTLFIQLLVYSIALSATEKHRILGAASKLSLQQATELIHVLSEERHRCMSLTGIAYWQLCKTMLAAGMEWLVLLQNHYGASSQSAVAAEPARVRIQQTLEALLEGRNVDWMEASAAPLFPLLVEDAIDHLSQSKDPLLIPWMAGREMSPTSVRVQMSEMAIQNLDQADASAELRASCFGRSGVALAQHAGTIAEDERDQRAEWFDRAIAAFERSLEQRPDDAATLMGLGTALDDRGRATPEDEREQRAEWFDRAIAAYERSLAQRPDDAATLNNLGSALANRGRATPEDERDQRAEWFDRAIAACERSLAQRPDDAATLHNLGSALDNRGRATPEGERDQRAEWFDRAIAACERSLAQRPDDAATLNNLLSSLLWKRYVELDQQAAQELLRRASDAADKLMSLDPDAGRYNFACVLAIRGDADQALLELGQLLSAHPERRQAVADDDDFESLQDLPEFQRLISPD